MLTTGISHTGVNKLQTHSAASTLAHAAARRTWRSRSPTQLISASSYTDTTEMPLNNGGDAFDNAHLLVAVGHRGPARCGDAAATYILLCGTRPIDDDARCLGKNVLCTEERASKNFTRFTGRLCGGACRRTSSISAWWSSMSVRVESSAARSFIATLARSTPRLREAPSSQRLALSGAR